jgi:hypothetical protein
MRTQETFGAATPGRRVLYSASWVLRVSAGAVTQADASEAFERWSRAAPEKE